MELSSICKIFTSIILIGSVIACKEDNDKSNVSLDIQEGTQKEVIAPSEAQDEIPECPEFGPSIQAMSINGVQEFNDGSDGDFYLATGETFTLEERIYNFNNIYLENNSNVEISEQANKDTAVIKINALGSCEFYGNLNFEGYEGTVEIRCDGQSHIGMRLTSGYSITLVGMGAIVISKSEDDSGGDGEGGSGAIISNGDDLDGDGLIDSELPGIVDLSGLDDFVFPDITIIESPTVITVLEPDTMIEADPDTFYICTTKP
ncbi:MAG: hypothetical protein JKY50_05255 [Oleispira sp.]|nr:hypothetical protein [Oleispira sp.]MBL4882700.1 hypothetical protein [Oleispira sp.]